MFSFASTALAADGYITKTNGTVQIGNGGGSSSASDGYICRTNGTTLLGAGGGSGTTGDGYYAQTNGTTVIGAASNPNDTGISGLAYYWNYNDLVQGSSVSTWPDRIRGADAHQADVTKQPTNSTSGVWFNASRLTNVDFTLPASQYSIWIVFKPNTVSAVYGCLIGDKGGNNGFFRNGAKLVYYLSGDRTLATMAAGVSYDLMFANAGTGSVGGGIGYTNGVATATITDKSVAQTFGIMGDDAFNESFQGYIKFIGIWTNTTLTSSDASTLYTYSQSH